MARARRFLPYLLAIAAAAGGYCIWNAYLRKSPTERIERLLDAACEAASEESIIRLSEAFAMDYRDDSGLERAAVLGQAQRFFGEVDGLTARRAYVRHEDPNLPAGANAATAIVVFEIRGRLAQGGQEFRGIAGNGADAFLLRFAKNRGDWKIKSSRRLAGSTPEELQRALTGDGS